MNEMNETDQRIAELLAEAEALRAELATRTQELNAVVDDYEVNWNNLVMLVQVAMAGQLTYWQPQQRNFSDWRR